MKKVVILLAAMMMLVCLIAAPVSAATTYISDLQIPYAVTAPTLDGVLSSGEWTAKFELPASKMINVSGTAPAELYINTYMQWDEEYLYIAYEVNDTNGGRLWYGSDGDSVKLYLDVNDIAKENGDLNMHAFSIYCFPVVASAGSTTPTGYHTRYPGEAEHEGSPDKLVQTDAGCSGSGNKWYLEQRITWSDLGALLTAAYQGKTLPTPAAGMVITFMPSYHDCTDPTTGPTNPNVGWYIGQNTRDDVNFASATPGCFGFKGTLAAMPAASSDDAASSDNGGSTPATSDMLSIGLLVSAMALVAGIAFVKTKKR